MTLAIGNDVSRYNITFNPSLASGPIDFSIQKATEGTTYVDLKYEEIWQGVSQVGIRGAYHYQRSGMSWEAQATHFLNISSQHDYHFSVLDVEEYGNIYNDTFFADTRRILDRWRNAGRFVVLYTNINGYNLLYSAMSRLYGTSGITLLNSVPLWLSYPNELPGHPVTPTTRPNWWMHQYTYKGLPARWGTGGTAVDENVFNGTVNDLRNVLGLGDTTPPPTGGQMKKGILNSATTVLNVRSGNSTAFPIVTTLNKVNGVSDEAYGELNTVSGWLHIQWIIRADGTRVDIDGWCHAGYLILTDYTPPPSGEKPVINISLRGEGYPNLDIEWEPNA